MRADRLLSILLLLQARGRLTGRELAERLEVSARTLHRDMGSLSAAGVPVLALRGSRGGWQLDEDWRTQVPGLDESELRALLMAAPRVIGDTRLAAAAERALGKLMAALPVSMRAQAVSIRQRLYVDPTGWRASTENLSLLPLVQDAVSRDRKLVIEYRRVPRSTEPRRESIRERVVDPLGLVAKGSAWYLVANTSQGLRTFRVSRIEKARQLDLPSHRPPDFDLAAHWKTATRQFEHGWSRCQATLRLEPGVAEWVKVWRIASPVKTLDNPDPEGWITLQVQFDHIDEARFIVLGLGARVDVIEPATLRDQVATEVAASAKRLRRKSQ